MITLKTMAPTARARPSSGPRIRAVSTMAKILMAGPEYKNAIAGPNPAPRFQIPAKRGSTVQEQTARMVPDTEATPYDMTFFAPAPRYFITAAWETNTDMAPAIKKAGTKHSSTCSCAYHLTRARDSIIAPVNRLLSSGNQKKIRKMPVMMLSGFQMVFQSIRLGSDAFLRWFRIRRKFFYPL